MAEAYNGRRISVRAYNGVNSRWYQSAIKQKTESIHTAGAVYHVHFEKVSGSINKQIDEAYKAKNHKSQYLPPMTSNRAIAATINIRPVENLRS